MGLIINYLKNVKREISNIIWPNRQTVFTHTLLVIVISLTTALVLYFVDVILVKLLNFIIRLF